MQRYKIGAVGAVCLLLSSLGYAQDEVDQLILKYRPDVQARMPVAEVQARAVRSVAESTGVQVSYQRAMASVLGAHVLKLPYPMSDADARLYAETVMAANPEIEYVEPDSKRYLKITRPSDPDFSQQWHLQSPAAFAGAANLVNAWDITKGSLDVIVGVLDSGVTTHTDLQANLVGGGAQKAGYDMISDPELANDGDGRDADPSDPGTAVDARGGDSVWHGTHVAGLVAATPDNGQFVAGTGWNTRILAVRILSDAAGNLSDEVDGMLWAAGESVPGVADNANPAQVLNLSLGTNGFEACARTEQAAVDAVRNKGVTVVVAAGNENRNVEGSAPANCKGVIAVAAVMQDGARAPFSNFGVITDIAAPGKAILSTLNSGLRAPDEDIVKAEDGTSMSAPQVSGVLALMLAANPLLRNAQLVPPETLPDLLQAKLTAAARPFPTAIAGSKQADGCNANQDIACVCTTDTCGAGLLDAFQAVKAVATAPTASIAIIGDNGRVDPGASVTLDGSASSDDSYGGKIVRYLWTQLAGETVTLAGKNTATASFTAPALALTEPLQFRLTLTDDTGLSANKSVKVSVKSADTGSGSNGGGGSLDSLFLLVLTGLLAVSLGRKR